MYNLIVIGGGPAGYTAALESVKLGKKVLLIEGDKLGGVCLNRGCIPTKSLLNSSKVYKKSKTSSNIGVENSSTSFNFNQAMEWKNSVVSDLRESLTGLLKQKAVEVIYGIGEIVDTHSVKVENTTYKTENILIATGAKPVLPPVPGIDSNFVYTSKEILNLKEKPNSITIIGGGVIGLEFASFFSQIGVTVNLVELCNAILPNMESRVTKVLEKSLDVNFYLGSLVEKIDKNIVTISKNDKNSTITSDIILVATGRKPNGTQFENLGIVENGAVIVNDYMETDIKGIYAVGDVTGKSFLAHGGVKMAETAVSNMFHKAKTMDFNLIPSVIYSSPEVASIGLTLKQVKEQNIPIIKNVFHLKNGGRYRAEDGFDKGLSMVIAHKETKKILGFHLVGTGVSEIITTGTLAIQEGYTLEQFNNIVFPHPTISESLKETVFYIN